MKNINMAKVFRLILSTLVLSLCWAGTGLGLNINLVAERATVTMADGNVVPMWGLRDIADTSHLANTWKIPVINVTLPDTLNLSLLNNLPADTANLAKPTSLMIPGLREDNMAPVWTDGTSGPRGTDVTKRVRSLNREAANPNGLVTYSWSNLRPGTFIIQSATHQSVQVQMGLYAVLVVHPATAGQAYDPTSTVPLAEVSYTTEQTLVFSEIDKALHDAIDADQYGSTAGPGILYTSTMDYHPSYYLINGQPAALGAQQIAVGSNSDDILLRLVNTGNQTKIPTFLGQDVRVIAQDGFLAPYSHMQYSVEMTPGKTMDVILSKPDQPVVKLYDSRSSVAATGAAGGGLLADLQVNFGQAQVLFPNGGEMLIKKQPVSVQWAPVATADNYSVFVTYNGTNFLSLASGLSATSLTWTPTRLSSVAKVKVAAYSGTTFLGVDESDAAFSIVPKLTVAVTSPNGGTIIGGAFSTVTWDAPVVARTFTIKHSRTGVGNWKTVATGLTGSSYSWKVPNIDNATNKIRILAFDGFGNPQSRDDSDADFIIQKGITVVLPNGGIVAAGAPYTVEWTTTVDTAYVVLRYSLDGGATFKRFARHETGTSKVWNVPVTTSTSALIKVSAYDANDVWLGDDLSTVFNIQ